MKIQSGHPGNTIYMEVFPMILVVKSTINGGWYSLPCLIPAGYPKIPRLIIIVPQCCSIYSLPSKLHFLRCQSSKVWANPSHIVGYTFNDVPLVSPLFRQLCWALSPLFLFNSSVKKTKWLVHLTAKKTRPPHIFHCDPTLWLTPSREQGHAKIRFLHLQGSSSYPKQHQGLTGGVSPASNCFGSSVCQRQIAYQQKLVFRCGEMAVFKHAYDVSFTWVLHSSVNITFIFSKKWMLGATLTGVCGCDTFAFCALFFTCLPSTRHLQNISHDWLCQSCAQWIERTPS